MLGDRVDLEWTALPAPPGQLYEGPQWLPDPGVFQWVDILGHSLHRWSPGTDVVDTRILDLEFTTVALPRDATRSIVASRSSLHEYDWEMGSLTTLGSWDFAPDVRFNDGAISPDGQIYIGTMSMERRTNAGCLFRFENGELHEILSGVGISNGLGWLANGETLYIDSVLPRVNTVDLSRPTPVLTTYAELEHSDEPDGLLVTPDQAVLVANWGNGKLLRWAPGGARLSDLTVPVRFPTSLALGGGDLDLLMLTSAWLEPPADRSAFDGQVLVAGWTGTSL